MCKIVVESGMVEKGDPRHLGYGGVSEVLLEQEDERNFDRVWGSPADPELSDLYNRGVNGLIRLNKIFLEPLGSEVKTTKKGMFNSRLELFEALSMEEKQIISRNN